MKDVMLTAILCLLMVGACQKIDDPGIANPASVYCEEQGGNLEMVTAPDGGVQGVCILKDGTRCDEWAYFQGECPKICGDCPMFAPPGPDFCPDGRLVAGEKDSCGCQGPPRCDPVACTEDARICPDGTVVGRVPPDCEFAPCPGDCSCPEGYRKEGDACNPECYYSRPPCLAPSIPCERNS